MVLLGRPPPRGCLSVSSVPPEEHGIQGPVPRPPGGPLVGPAQPPVHFPHQGEGLPPQRVRDCAPVHVPRPALLRPLCRPPSLLLHLRRRRHAPSPLRRGHPRRLHPRRGGGLLVLVSWGLGGDELAGVRVDVVEVVVVVVVVVVGVVRRHLLDAGGMHLTGCTSGCGGAQPSAPLPSPRPPPWDPVPRPSCPLGPLPLPLPLPLGPFPVPCPCRGSRLSSPTPRPARSPPCPAPCAWGALPAPLTTLPVPWPLPDPLPEPRVPPLVHHAPARSLSHHPSLPSPAPGPPARAPARPSRAPTPPLPPACHAVRRSPPPRRCALPGPLAGRPAAFAVAAA